MTASCPPSPASDRFITLPRPAPGRCLWAAVRAVLSALAVLVLLGVSLSLAPSAQASPDGDRCLRAAREAAARHDVPLRLLWTIGLAESGRNGSAWPWTLNVAGRGAWFESRAEAEAAIEAATAAGRWNIDIGCFQISTRWHGDAFASPAAMLDPRSNADYAARFLAGLYAETGSWPVASGHYHSRTPALATAYRARLGRLAGLAARHTERAEAGQNAGGNGGARLAPRHAAIPPAAVRPASAGPVATTVRQAGISRHHRSPSPWLIGQRRPSMRGAQWFRPRIVATTAAHDDDRRPSAGTGATAPRAGDAGWLLSGRHARRAVVQ